MSTVNTTPVVGLDGVSPVYDPNGLWRIWGMQDIWLGKQAAKRFVPKEKDFVVDSNGESYTTYYVDHLDPITLIPTLREIRPANMSFGFTQTDVLFGVGPGTQADTYRCYIDKSTMPYNMAVDVRLKVGGSMSSYCKIFRGADLSQTGEVISRIYDSSGNVKSDRVALELIALDSHINYSIKSIGVCQTISDVTDGELLTAVIYNDQGHVVSKRQLLAENTSFIRAVNASKKYVTSIAIDSPFISTTSNHLLEFPLNVPVNALNIFGVVNYSDGSSLKLPIDGTKFKLEGLHTYLSSIVGQQIELVLSYALSVGEEAYAGVTSDGHFITEAYSMVTLNPNAGYSVKLFVYPRWLPSSQEYTLDWYLYNLDRNIWFLVSDYVVFAENTGPFNTNSTAIQRKSVFINLADVSPTFKPFIHTQVVEIWLRNKPNVNVIPWSVSHEAVDGRLMFNRNIDKPLVAKLIDAKTINIGTSYDDFNSWRQAIYLDNYPLLNRSVENTPPMPTHLIVEGWGTASVTISIERWKENITLTSTISNYQTVVIRFIKRTETTDLQLAVVELMVKS